MADRLIPPRKTKDGCMWRITKILLFILFLLFFIYCVLWFIGVAFMAWELSPFYERAIEEIQRIPKK